MGAKLEERQEEKKARHPFTHKPALLDDGALDLVINKFKEPLLEAILGPILQTGANVLGYRTLLLDHSFEIDPYGPFLVCEASVNKEPFEVGLYTFYSLARRKRIASLPYSFAKRILISDSDFLKVGKPLYSIRYRVEGVEIAEDIGDDSILIFNVASNCFDDESLGNLALDLRCKDPERMHSPILKEALIYLNGEGREELLKERAAWKRGVDDLRFNDSYRESWRECLKELVEAGASEKDIIFEKYCFYGEFAEAYDKAKFDCYKKLFANCIEAGWTTKEIAEMLAFDEEQVISTLHKDKPDPRD